MSLIPNGGPAPRDDLWGVSIVYARSWEERFKPPEITDKAPDHFEIEREAIWSFGWHSVHIWRTLAWRHALGADIGTWQCHAVAGESNCCRQKAALRSL